MEKLKQIWKNATEYKIAVFALLAWFLFELAGRLWGIETYPVGYWQKVAFAVVSILIIAGVAWLWLAKTFPELKSLLDPDNQHLNQLRPWQKIKLAAFLFCFFVFCTVLLASLY